MRRDPDGQHSELGWLLNETGLFMLKLTELLSSLNATLEDAKNLASNREFLSKLPVQAEVEQRT